MEGGCVMVNLQMREIILALLDARLLGEHVDAHYNAHTNIP